jgi:hypothetical protein
MGIQLENGCLLLHMDDYRLLCLYVCSVSNLGKMLFHSPYVLLMQSAVNVIIACVNLTPNCET